jgi:mannitol/fructose-specific phosphotransferase system IIA component
MTDILSLESIQLGAALVLKEDAIQRAGELLVVAGCVIPEYIASMLEREESMSTYIGNGVAIPHGEFKNLGLVNCTGISVLQVPEGIEWEDGERAYLVIGIAAVGDDHLQVLENLAMAIEDPDTADLLAQTDDPQVILEKLNFSIRRD